MKAILGKKIGMTTIYDQEKGAQNVTLIECEPNEVFALRNSEKDGYDAAILRVGKYTREFRSATGTPEVKVKDSVDVSIFSVGDKVKVSGTSKAKGFQGVVKRHGFAGSPASHGHRHDLRAPGSIGSAFPQHVFKGRRMAGRMGGERSSVRGLSIVLVDTQKNLIAIKGAVPGVSGRMVEVVGL